MNTVMHTCKLKESKVVFGIPSIVRLALNTEGKNNRSRQAAGGHNKIKNLLLL